MQYQRFDPSDCGFPRPSVPILPNLSWQSLGRAHDGIFKPLAQTDQAHFFARGRYALHEAYRLAGVGRSGALLAPSYHCRTMLDPAIRLGASIALYALHPGLSPDLDSLRATLQACQQPVRALLVTHYFGFAQDLQLLAQFCQQNGIALIEDCSHALFLRSAISRDAAEAAGAEIGATGHYGVASPYKFFPCEDGGMLWANAEAEPPLAQQRPQSFKQELKGIFHALQRARTPAPLDCDVDPPRNDGAAGHDVIEQTSATSPHYLPAEEHLQSLASSRWIMRHTNVDRLATRRRENYLQWVHAVSDLQHCRPLYPQLADATVPYMFPLIVDNPEIHFFALKRLGVPIWRWDDMAVSACTVASRYRLNLLHLPCHQELSTKQMAWMTAAVRDVMRSASNKP